MNRKTIYLLLSAILIGLAIGIAFLFGWNRLAGVQISELPDGITSDPEIAGVSAFAPEKGAMAPLFTLESISGDQITLEELQGKVVLLNFWATWCGPCRLEMPTFQTRHEQISDKLEIVAIDFDEPKEDVQAFADELGLTFTILLDPGGNVQNLYRIRGYPTSIFLDESGVVKIVHIGIMAESQLDGYLLELGVID
ncbi:MAG: redoxin domain-containing protein [Anaerolineae bacterium]|nr:redoxin domain-containing protein [Anaerolineae bacterium]